MGGDAAVGGRRAELGPDFVAVHGEAPRVEIDLRVPERLAVWPGHFPGFHLVPGVLQIDWVMRCASDRLGAGALCAIESVKFRSPLRPGQPFRLTLEIHHEGRALEFRIEHEGTVFSAGRLGLEPGDE